MRVSDWSSDVCSSDLPGPSCGPGRAGEGYFAASISCCAVNGLAAFVSVCHAMAWRNSRKALKPSLSPRCFINSDARLSASSLEVGESTRKSQISPSMCQYHWDAGWPAYLAMASRAAIHFSKSMRSEEHTIELQS